QDTYAPPRGRRRRAGRARDLGMRLRHCAGENDPQGQEPDQHSAGLATDPLPAIDRMRVLEGIEMAQQTVGMIGLGIMGSAMSYNLLRAGVRVIGYDVVPRARSEHKRAGGVAAKSPREVAKRTDIVITSLPSARALGDVASQLAKSAKRGTV